MTNEPTNNDTPETLPDNPDESTQSTNDTGSMDAASLETPALTDLVDDAPATEARGEPRADRGGAQRGAGPDEGRGRVVPGDGEERPGDGGEVGGRFVGGSGLARTPIDGAAGCVTGRAMSPGKRPACA